MADFPTDLSELQDNVDDVMAKYVNNLEEKVGVDESTDSESIDYMLRQGWIFANETWTRESDTSFSEPIDATGKFQKGDKIRYKQGGAYKYQYIINVGSYSGGKTIMTTTGGSDYTVADAAITDNYYSKAENPQGFPGWFNWTPATYTGFSSDPTDVVHKFMIIGSRIEIYFRHGTAGTSNADTYKFTAPVTSATISNVGWNTSLPFAIDNGAISTTKDVVTIVSNGTSISLQKANSSHGWTTSGSKRAAGNLVYEF